MKANKPSKTVKKDAYWQKEIEKRVKAEKVQLDHPQGKERFKSVLKRLPKP